MICEDTGRVSAPFRGSVTLQVAVGQRVRAGAVLATIEAMKMETAITAPHAGTVERVVADGADPVEGGDLVVLLST